MKRNGELKENVINVQVKFYFSSVLPCMTNCVWCARKRVPITSFKITFREYRGSCCSLKRKIINYIVIMLRLRPKPIFATYLWPVLNLQFTRSKKTSQVGGVTERSEPVNTWSEVLTISHEFSLGFEDSANSRCENTGGGNLRKLPRKFTSEYSRY